MVYSGSQEIVKNGDDLEFEILRCEKRNGNLMVEI